MGENVVLMAKIVELEQTAKENAENIDYYGIKLLMRHHVLYAS